MLIIIGSFAIVQASAICIGYVRGKEHGIVETSKYFREIMLKRQMGHRFSRKALPFDGTKIKISKTMKPLTFSNSPIKRSW